MTSVEELRALKERVEAATGPDRAIDKAIYGGLSLRADWGGDLSNHGYGCCAFVAWGPAPLSGSIDAALGLVERVLPGWGGTLVLDPPSVWLRPTSAAEIEHYRKTGFFPNPVPNRADGPIEAATLPLGILSALLSALIARAEKEGVDADA